MKVQLFTMPSLSLLRTASTTLGLILALFCAASSARAQDEDQLEGEASKPVNLYRQGQQAHARGAAERSKELLEEAVALYEQAIKLDSEFPEAEYQRAVALAMLGRDAEAEQGLKRASELRADWSMPYAALGDLLARQTNREREAEEALSRAIALDASNASLYYRLAELRRRAGDPQTALELLRRATEEADSATPDMWAARGDLERATGDTASALKSLTRAIRMDSNNTLARIRRAEMYVEERRFDRAAQDLSELEETSKKDAGLALAVASLYAGAGDKASARRVLTYLPETARRSPEAEKIRAAIDEVACESTPEAREALEKTLLVEPDNASLLACLGELYRTLEPARSLAYYKRSAELEPSNAKYATGYAAALLQLRRFADSAEILRRVLQASPDDYVARANYATALYEMELFREAVAEYKLMLAQRPDLAVINFFMGTAHDKLGEYVEALAAYEAFLARADPAMNQLEIDKVNLRLPSLRNQIKRGEGVKKKGTK